MEDRNKISLRSGRRKKRPTISAPRQISGPIAQDDSNRPPLPGADPSQASAQPRPRPPPMAGGKTSDLVKRRYSTRFNQPSSISNGGAPPMPQMPSLANYEPRETVAAARKPPSRSGPGVAPVIDIKGLRDPKLKPDRYVQAALSDATEDQIREFEESLRQVKTRVGTDLQQSVMQNRTQFIKISKEAEKLKSEMRNLKNFMSELKVNTTAMRAAAAKSDEPMPSDLGVAPGISSRRDRRTSIADRSAMWNSQMQALYKGVEGSQKFLPNAVGRHVVQDAGPWIELDNATYKSRRAMQIFLLNDHLLIASRKKRKADAPGADARGPMMKLVADRCWPLLDVEVVDMSSTGESSNSGRNKLADAIMVRGVGQESFIYRTEKPQDPEKKQLLLNVRKAIEQLRKGLRSEMEANNKARETINYFASRDPGLLQKTELLATLSDIKDMLIEVDGKQQNLRWVESEMDDLDIDVAMQRFEDAVVRVEKLKAIARGLKNHAIAQDFINFKVNERCVRLANMIGRELEMTHDNNTKTRRNVSWLTRLGFEDSARESYLAARSGTIHKRTRQCIFQGDLHLYIWELSFVYFMVIHNTVQCFQSCFPPPMMSVCVKWAKEEVDAFNIILARQLSSTELRGQVWTQCMERAKEHSKLLSEVGLDFENLVGKNLMIYEPIDQGPSVGLGLS
ncbi:exocyst complex component exo84 [Fusarium graminearum]|uniref:Exocyst complex component EXO84 n=3 Tax=Gibberella zeae TaxID=5518 RepID=EXO84_GIBZE|nr:exocyst complex component EXO84 [Fusarium graminearum PH-1]Q4HYZ2.1 RecName: Full=Exocyst complex component EXO84 [Fusarium graminearum PH-1]EYB31520.1 hypothetical protein FG05_09816 [Fusarium graminearum]ESU16446.1 exocyst complex component EXO84 [Fusarium graminearum PH-1]KAI6769422.1 hypothetical protein HG531_010526 [Fusarium graminearum]PCD18046.1 exocyst complex component EXO84 [Fusarium graminearum]CAF3470002.1 unnamed protein product [Fusarium graminearum]|eukprot:XP_011327870.1 exocyst complex component EXO84 [Fusarium graminearum PH-1]